MKKAVPSYLYLRNGIYYFQLRIYKGKKLIRRSTKTGNKREALQIARKWWVEIMSTSDEEFMKNIDALEASAERREELYARGKYLYGIMDDIDADDGKLIEQAMLEHFHGNFDIEAFNYYQDFISKNGSTQNEKDAESTIGSSDLKVLVLNQDKSSKQISDLVEEYIVDCVKGPRSLGEEGEKKLRMQLGLFVEMIENPAAKDLTADILSKKYAHKIKDVPTSMNKKKKEFFVAETRKNIDEIISITEKKKLRTLSKNTIWSYVTTVKAFLKWAEKRFYVVENLGIAFEGFKKAGEDEKIKALPFTDLELSKIFYSDYFVVGRSMKKNPERFWLPLIALFSGARRAEIAQLYVSDVKRDSDTRIWFFDLNVEDDKRLKTKNSKRVVPIHKSLITLGFITYLESQKKRNEKYLFPNLVADVKKGDQVSKWFTRFMKKCGVTAAEGERKSFHSFRHTVINYEKQYNLNAHVMSELTGHSYDMNKVHAGYQQGFDLKRKRDELNKVKHGIDVSKIRKWE
jgi:integrase